MPNHIVTPVPGDLLDRARHAMGENGTNDAEHDALVELVDLIDESRPLNQLLNEAADLILEFQNPSYSDYEAWRDAMNMLVNVAGYLATLPADRPALHDLDESQRLALLRDAIEHGWSGHDDALAYSSYFTDAVFAGVNCADHRAA